MWLASNNKLYTSDHLYSRVEIAFWFVWRALHMKVTMSTMTAMADVQNKQQSVLARFVLQSGSCGHECFQLPPESLFSMFPLGVSGYTGTRITKGRYGTATETAEWKRHLHRVVIPQPSATVNGRLSGSPESLG